MPSRASGKMSVTASAMTCAALCRIRWMGVISTARTSTCSSSSLLIVITSVVLRK